MKNRIERINEEIRREIAVIISNLKDPRVPLITSVVKADVTNDLKYVKVYVSIMGDEISQKNAISILESAEGFIRRELGSKLDIRFIPEIIFVLDKSIEYGAHINKIIQELSGEGKNDD